MSGHTVVGYDGSNGAQKAVDFAVACAKDSGCVLELVHVLEWSPYSFLTPEELDERHKRREEELARAKSEIMDPIVDQVGAAGVEVKCTIRYGNVADVIATIAHDGGAAQIIVGRTGGSAVAARLFGSVPGALVQIADVPVTVVP